jgi:hypothetical protein
MYDSRVLLPGADFHATTIPGAHFHARSLASLAEHRDRLPRLWHHSDLRTLDQGRGRDRPGKRFGEKLDALGVGVRRRRQRRCHWIRHRDARRAGSAGGSDLRTARQIRTIRYGHVCNTRVTQRLHTHN